MKLEKQPTLADSICDLRKRKVKAIFSVQHQPVLQMA